jgi:hypothetical protein
MTPCSPAEVQQQEEHSPKISMNFYQTTWRCAPEDGTPHLINILKMLTPEAFVYFMLAV